MQVGDTLLLAPTIGGTELEGPKETEMGAPRKKMPKKKLPCTVTYIHPQRRYFTVEFRSPVTGETWRESMRFTIKADPEDNHRKAPKVGYHYGLK